MAGRVKVVIAARPLPVRQMEGRMIEEVGHSVCLERIIGLRGGVDEEWRRFVGN